MIVSSIKPFLASDELDFNNITLRRLKSQGKNAKKCLKTEKKSDSVFFDKIQLLLSKALNCIYHYYYYYFLLYLL